MKPVTSRLGLGLVLLVTALSAAWSAELQDESLVRLRKSLYEAVPTVREAAETQLCLMLGVPGKRQAAFIKAFKQGNVAPEALETHCGM